MSFLFLVSGRQSEYWSACRSLPQIISAGHCTRYSALRSNCAKIYMSTSDLSVRGTASGRREVKNSHMDQVLIYDSISLKQCTTEQKVTKDVIQIIWLC